MFKEFKAFAARGNVVDLAVGVIIGAAYVVTGVPSPLIFALLTVAFAMVPFGA